MAEVQAGIYGNSSKAHSGGGGGAGGCGRFAALDVVEGTLGTAIGATFGESAA